MGHPRFGSAAAALASLHSQERLPRGPEAAPQVQNLWPVVQHIARKLYARDRGDREAASRQLLTVLAADVRLTVEPPTELRGRCWIGDDAAAAGAVVCCWGVCEWGC